MIIKIINFILNLIFKINIEKEKNNDNNLYNHIRNLYLKNGWKFEEINIFGIGDDSRQQEDVFNDKIGLATNGNVFIFNGTVNPGKYYTESGGYNKDRKGVAHLCYGFHENAYIVGKHHSYFAMVQRGAPVKIWRDKNKNYKKDGNEIITKGYFGINIHRANSAFKSETINKWSAGCQVIQDPSDFKLFMNLILTSKKYINNVKSKFSYALFHYNQFKEFEDEII